jgi:transcriptional regulator with XRE-family HTH domain
MGVMGNDLVREARKRAGLSQRALAERAGTTQSSIARLESGRTSPSFDTVLRLLRHCGMDLHVNLVERDASDWMQAQQILPLPPGERLERAVRFARRIRRLQAEVRRESA